MFKKKISICLALILILGLTACGHEHQWTPADCTTPGTCLGCGETQGEALGHTWLDATYDSPKTCTVCAATEGERLMTYFEEYGLEARILEKSGEYQLDQPCAADDTKTTIARIIVEEYKTIAGDETHEALDGYEWMILTLTQWFSDENARKYGGNLGMYLWTGKYASGTPQEDDDHSGLFEGGMPYCVTKDGVDYPDGLLKIKEEVSDWAEDEEGSRYIDIVVTVSVRVPVGYDGFVFGLENAKWEWPEGVYLHEVITDHALLFCMD